MAALRASLCVVLMLTTVTSKPICLHDADDSSKSSESSESNSSEEAALRSEDPLQTSPLDVDAGSSPATLDASALPDPQTSGDADASPFVPDHPSALGVSQDTPESAQDSINTMSIVPETEAQLHPVLTEADIISGTNQPLVTTTNRGLSTPAFPPHAVTPTPLTFSVDPSLSIPIGTALTGAPVCFTFQFVTPEPEPVRGDNI